MRTAASWIAAARGARAADDLLRRVAPQLVRKAANPLTRAGFDDVVRKLSLQILDETEKPEAQAIIKLKDALDKNWPKMSAAERERAIKQAEAIIGRIASDVVPPLRKVLRDEGKRIVDMTRDAAIARFELPIAAMFGAQDERIVEHATNSQSLFVTDYYGNRGAIVGQRARDIVAQGLKDGLDQYEIGRQLEAAVGASLGRSSSYYPMVASVFAARARTWSVLSSFEEAEIEQFEVSAVMDEQTCFAKGTQVLLGDGRTQKAIDKISKGELVMSCKGRPKRVLALIKSPVRKWGEFVFADETVGPLLVTLSHGILTSRGWIRANALTTADLVAVYAADGKGAASSLWSDERTWGGRRRKIDPRAIHVAPWPHPDLDRIGRFTAISSIVWTETGRTDDAYDLEVEDDAGYIAENILVHNSHICRFLDGQVFSTTAAADSYRKTAESPPEDVKQLQPFVRERRGDDGVPVMYVGNEQSQFDIARVVDSAMGQKDKRGKFESTATPADMAANGISAPPYHPHCRTELVPVM